MENPDSKQTAPPPEVLQPQADAASNAAGGETNATPASGQTANRPPRRLTYRPSHKATFIGAAVVIGILLLNVGIIAVVLRQQEKNKQKEAVQLTVSQEVLDKLGVNRSTVGDSGIELVINPNTTFNGSVEVGGDVTIGGELKLNGNFSASSGTFGNLQAGDTSVNNLNINGDATANNLTLRNNLIVAGTTTMQGPATVDALFTVNNHLNVAGNVAVGGELSVNVLHVSSLIVDSNIIVGGHLISGGEAPSVSAGPAVGSNGTVSISGNDISGTVAVNTGVGATSGILASVTYRNAFGKTPHVLVTAVGAGIGSFYTSRNSTGFSIGVNAGLAPGGYAFDYFVIQ